MSESGEKTRKGLIWMLLSGAGSQLVILVTNFLILRFLDRALLGEAMNAADVLLLLNAMSSLGLGQFIVVKTHDREDLAFHATVLFLGVGAVVLVAALVFSSALSNKLNSPEIGKYLPGLVISAMVDRIGVVPERILIRDQRFRPVALARGLGEATYGIVSLTIAAITGSAMAVVYANIVRAVLRTGLFLRAVGFRSWLTPVTLEMKKFGEALAYGLPLSIASSAIMASRKFDNLLVSRFFGPAQAQDYRTAYNYAETPGGFISDAIVDVVLSSFVREDRATRGKAFVRASAILAAIKTPALFGLAIVAPTLTEAILPPRWSGIAPLLAALSIAFSIRATTMLSIPILQANHRTKLVTLLEVANAILVIGFVATLGRFGTLEACYAVGLAGLLRAVLGVYAVRMDVDVPLLELLWGQIVPIIASIPMVAAVYFLRKVWISAEIGFAGVRLAVEILTGAVAFLGTFFLLFRERAKDLLSLAKGFRRARAEA